MAKNKSNLELLRETLNDEQKEFLDDVIDDFSIDIDSKAIEVINLRMIISDKESYIEEIIEGSKISGYVIDAGIGKIRYEVEGSIDLMHLMEVIARIIKEDGATALLRQLEETHAF